MSGSNPASDSKDRVAHPNREGRPQLVMWRRELANLPPVELPAGHRLGEFAPGLEGAWDEIIGRSFGAGSFGGSFDRIMRSDPAFRPDRILFVFEGARPVATASAWHQARYGDAVGYLHYVGVLPEAWGKWLGREISLACLHKMVVEGRSEAILQTDDFRIPAIKTYLKLGFVPRLVHENQRERWREVFRRMGRPELSETFGAILNGALFELAE